MTLHGRCVINDAHDSPLSFPGAGTFLAFSGDGIYRNQGACDMKPTAGPVPAGKYWIVKRPAGGLRSHVSAGVRDRYNHVMNGATFRHRRDDWGTDDDTWNEGVNAVTSVCTLARYQQGGSLCYMVQILPCRVMHC